jgi:CHRD domain-containing protein
MRRHALFTALSLAATLIVGGCNDSTSPQSERFTATMNGANERPTARTTPATGTANFTLTGETLSWTITLSNITNVTAAHIHIGGANDALGILLPLTPPVSNTTITGSITKANFQPPGAPNAAVTFDQMIELMRTGGAYANVHTNNTANDPTNNSGPGDFPGGEIRGQITLVP